MIIPQLYLSLRTLGALLAPSTVKFFFVEEKVVEFPISVKHMPTTSMLADPLTKGLLVCVCPEHVTPHEIVRSLESLF